MLNQSYTGFRLRMLVFLWQSNGKMMLVLQILCLFKYHGSWTVPNPSISTWSDMIYSRPDPTKLKFAFHIWSYFSWPLPKRIDTQIVGFWLMPMFFAREKVCVLNKRWPLQFVMHQRFLWYRRDVHHLYNSFFSLFSSTYPWFNLWPV
jgi:hypothetical protein